MAGVVEDYVEGVDDTLLLVAVAEAAYALVYAHRKLGLIPNHLPHIGHADESSIFRAILIEKERVLSEYAERHDIDWVTLKA